MADYIKIHFSLLGSKGYKKLIGHFGQDATHYLVHLWINIGIHHPDGILYGWDSEDIENYADWSGAPGNLLEQLLVNDFLFINSKGRYEVCGWAANNKHLCGRDEKRKQRAKAAYINHYGKTEGMEIFNSKYALKETTVNENPHITDIPSNKLNEVNPNVSPQAIQLLKLYETKSVRTCSTFREKALSSITYWLSVYTFEQIIGAIDQYINECANNGTPRRYMRRSYTFFEGDIKSSSFFQSYVNKSNKVPENQADEQKIQADECYRSFNLVGGCTNSLKGALNFCNYCKTINVTIRQTEMLANPKLRGCENASTNTTEQNTVGKRL